MSPLVLMSFLIGLLKFRMILRHQPSLFNALRYCRRLSHDLVSTQLVRIDQALRAAHRRSMEEMLNSLVFWYLQIINHQ